MPSLRKSRLTVVPSACLQNSSLLGVQRCLQSQSGAYACAQLPLHTRGNAVCCMPAAWQGSSLCDWSSGCKTDWASGSLACLLQHSSALDRAAHWLRIADCLPPATQSPRTGSALELMSTSMSSLRLFRQSNLRAWLTGWLMPQATPSDSQGLQPCLAPNRWDLASTEGINAHLKVCLTPQAPPHHCHSPRCHGIASSPHEGQTQPHSAQELGQWSQSDAPL